MSDRLAMKLLPVAVLVLGMCVASLSSHGQEGDRVRVELVSLAWDRPIKGLLYGAVSEPQEMDVYARGFSAPANYEGPALLEFYRLLPPEEEGGAPVRDVVGRAALPGETSKVLLLFRPLREEEGERYQVVAMDNSLARFPPGSFRFFNFTNIELVGVVGSETLRVGAGATAIERPRGDENGNVEVRLFTELAGQRRAVYSSVWGVRESRRTSVFILADPSSTRDLEIRKFVEPVVE
jgi:hypothetical protein